MAGLTQEEKMKKAEEAAKRRNDKAEGGAEDAAVQNEGLEAATKPDNEKTEKEKEFVITVDGNQGYCGVGAGGIQFANGQAVTKSKRMASWFREHPGYTVSER